MGFAELMTQLPVMAMVVSFVLIIISAVTILRTKGLTLQDPLLWLLVVTVFNIVGVVVWIVYSSRRRSHNEERSEGGSRWGRHKTATGTPERNASASPQTGRRRPGSRIFDV